MISKEWVYNNVLPKIKKEGRTIDYLLVMSLFENKDEELLKELKTYQNKDLGFGNGLEPDVQMPNSSIVATNIAIEVLGQIRDQEKSMPFVKDIVSFLESQYDKSKDGFKLVTKEVDNYPHAVWWNFENYDTNFTYGNPDAEVIGFMFKHRNFLTSTNIIKQVNNVVNHIRNDEFLKSDLHNVSSCLLFHKYLDKDVRNLIHNQLHKAVNQLIIRDKDKWDEYGTEPYKLYLIDPHFTENHFELLSMNLDRIQHEVKSLSVMPNWTWYQYDNVFESTVKYQWMGFLYYKKIKALRLHRNI